MHDGIVRPLEVWDVPEMKNLISFLVFLISKAMVILLKVKF
jgi:hypothetical protein